MFETLAFDGALTGGDSNYCDVVFRSWNLLEAPVGGP